MVRYDSGETLASIARTYDCSPPAISYIVSRSRARNASAEASRTAAPPLVAPSEPQLVKNSAGESVSAAPVLNDQAAAAVRPVDSPPQVAAAPKPAVPLGAQRQMPREPGRVNGSPAEHRQGNGSGHGLAERDGAPRPAGFGGSPNGKPRFLDNGTGVSGSDGRRQMLHLSRGGAPSENRNGHSAAAAQGDDGQHYAPHPAPQRPAPAMHDRLPPQRNAGDHNRQPYPQQQGLPELPIEGPALGNAPAPRVKEGVSYIDQALRERVDGDIAAFLAAFDTALLRDTLESRVGLREATDRLLRAGARTRIELERLEARVPLARREPSRPEEPAWRPR